nr:hypothetical protein [uncultured Alistipes sp.]
MRMPDGEWYTIAVFIRDSAQEEADDARTIAEISEAVFRHISGLKKK